VVTAVTSSLRITRRSALVTAGASALVVLVLGILVAQAWPPLLELDARIDTSVHSWALDNAWAVQAAEVLQTMGYFRFSVWVVAATTIVLLVARRPRLALALVLVAALAPTITNLIKPVVGRARPVWEQSLGAEATLSYPSGHATAGIAVYAACAVALSALVRSTRWRAALVTVGVAIGIAMGLSRLVIGVHWPSDVVGGWGVAVAVAGAASAALLLGRSAPRAQ
jgi:undecaprenyl-diphosphatase